MILRDSLVVFISEQGLKLNGELTESTSLVKSGLFNSLALFNLAQWVEEQIGGEVDLTVFDLATEWDTIPDILKFVERHQAARTHRQEGSG